MLHPSREVEVVLETLVVVMEVVLLGMTSLVITSVIKVALVAAMMVAVGMAIMMEAVLEVAGSYKDFGNYNNQSSILDP